MAPAQLNSPALEERLQALKTHDLRLFVVDVLDRYQEPSLPCACYELLSDYDLGAVCFHS